MRVNKVKIWSGANRSSCYEKEQDQIIMGVAREDEGMRSDRRGDEIRGLVLPPGENDYSMNSFT